MKAGRELDVIVAVNVIGFKPSPSGEALLNTETNLMCVHPEYEDGEKYVFAKINDWTIPHYSTNIEDAWLVADKLKIAIIPQSESAPEQYKYLAEYSSYTPWGEDKKIEVFAETVPLAICLAALKAVGVEQ